MGVLIGSAVIPIALTMSWGRLTGTGMIVGSLSGTTIALIVWLTMSAIQPAGLSDFFASTGKTTFMEKKIVQIEYKDVALGTCMCDIVVEIK